MRDAPAQAERHARITAKIEAIFDQVEPGWRDLDDQGLPRVRYSWELMPDGQTKTELDGSGVSEVNRTRLGAIIIEAIEIEDTGGN